MDNRRYTRFMRTLKLFFHRKFTLRETQQLILDGWIVQGDRKTAYRNGQTISYLQPLEARSEQQKSH